jgi:hypothetical protein
VLPEAPMIAYRLLMPAVLLLVFYALFRPAQRLAGPYEKVAAGERICDAEALRLFESKDLNALGAIADLARDRRVETARPTSLTVILTTRITAS